MAGRNAAFGIEPVEKLGRNLTFSLLDTIGRDIITGRYQDQVFPTEAELAKQYGVSRSVTREAVKMLGAKGLLSARPRQGTVVRPTTDWNLFDTDVLRWILSRKFSINLLRHFNELRIAIEPQAAALAAITADEDDIARIDAGLKRMELAREGMDDPLTADIEFHLALLRATKNPFYNQLSNVVSTALQASIRLTNRMKGQSSDLQEHTRIRDAIVEHNPEDARAAMLRIIADVQDLIDSHQDANTPVE